MLRSAPFETPPAAAPRDKGRVSKQDGYAGALSHLGRERRLTPDHRECSVASRSGAAEPASAKDAEIGQRHIIRGLPVGQIIDEGPGVEPVCSRQCLGAYRAVHFISSEAERSLQ